MIQHQIQLSRNKEKKEDGMLWIVKSNQVTELENFLSKNSLLDLNWKNKKGNSAISIAVQCGNR